MTNSVDNQTIDHLFAQLKHCIIQDRIKLFRKLRQLQKSGIGSADFSERLTALQKAIDSSAQQVRHRLQNRPAINYPESLPVSQQLATILDTIQKHQVVILCGETGSGKTTQLPKMCLQLGLGCKGKIGHTQPRRLAARAVATRIAEELGSPPGEQVGYKVRFTDKTSNDSYIKVMTDGILLAECHHDPYLNQYDTLIIDEAHERSLNIDFLLGYIKRLLKKRKDLKVIITSATIDPERFSRHFNDAPIINVSGRTYPVEIRYRPLPEQADALSQGIADAVIELSREDRGDILVFLSGERDIRETADYLSRHLQQHRALAHTDILPLLARQSAQEQNRIFHPTGKRRIILATNVAETSLTVPGIKYVIDSGLARISRYSWRSKIQRLPIEKISQASANQRSGRCGRVSEGICIRLYEEEDFLARERFTPPEIQRTNLASVILQMTHLGLGRVEDFPFVEPPETRLVRDGYRLLLELGALQENSGNKKNRSDAPYAISQIGKTLARLPVDPSLARMLVEAKQENAIWPVLVIVTALATQDIRERPQDKKQAADQQHRLFADKKSDFLFFLNCWQAYQEQKKALSQNQLRKWCKKHFLSFMRLREWHDTFRQLQKTLSETGFSITVKHADYDAIHRAILTGLPGNIGLKEDKREYQGARNRKFWIHPGSMLFKKASKWIISAEIVETSQVYARTNACIEPKWIEEKLSHLIKRSWQDAHWQEKQGQVSALEQGSLFGLPVYSKRRVNYGPINPLESRRIFIENALVQMQMHCKEDFFLHNKQCIESIQALEAKSRRLDILADDATLYAFYDPLIPDTVYNVPLFKKWFKTLNHAEKQALYMDQAAIMQHSAEGVDSQLFPDYLVVDDMQLPLHYHFDTRHEHDGVTLTVPLAALSAINIQRCEWLVPGLLKDKMTALIRSLPKALRRNFVPAPNFAEACFEALQVSDLPLCTAMAQHLKKMTGIDIPFDAWQPEQLDTHFFFHYEVIDDNGKILAAGRDLARLQTELKHLKSSSVSSQLVYPEDKPVSPEVLDDLPAQIETESHGIKVTAYPALIKKGKQVQIKAFASAHEAATENRKGMLQLIINALPEPVRYLKKIIPDCQKLCLLYASMGSCDHLQRDIIEAVIQMVFLSTPIRSSRDFHARLQSEKHRLVPECEKLGELLLVILTHYREIQKRLKKTDLRLLDTQADISQQLEQLFPEHFIVEINSEHLQHYPRYLQAILSRLDKAPRDNNRDRENRLQIAPFIKDYQNRRAMNRKNNSHSEQLEKFRWMLEEFRVSLFAQELKTQYPVSAKRLKKYWNSITDSY